MAGSRLALITPRDLSPERNLADLRAAVGGFIAGLPRLTARRAAGDGSTEHEARA